MPDPTQLPFLIHLLDDDSTVVRENVLRQLRSFGLSLVDEVIRQRLSLTEEQIRIIRPVLDEQNRVWLKRQWPTWLLGGNDKEKLEAALSMLSEFLHLRFHPVKLGALLDELLLEFEATGLRPTPIELSRFLFSLKGLGGVGQGDYYNPLNSSLVYVIEQKRGIPISLACIYILVGYRLGMEIEGCNVPGHFLAIAALRSRKVVVDCFNGGRVLGQSGLRAVDASLSLDDFVRLQCRASDIVARVLRNLAKAFEQERRKEEEELMKELSATFEET